MEVYVGDEPTLQIPKKRTPYKSHNHPRSMSPCVKRGHSQTAHTTTTTTDTPRTTTAPIHPLTHRNHTAHRTP